MSSDPDGEDSTGLTEEDYQRFREFAAKDPAERDPGDLVPDEPEETGDAPGETDRETDENGSSTGSSGERSYHTCRSIRKRMADATTAKEVVDKYPDRHTSDVMRHAYGECKCEVDYPPKASPQIRAGECREFRDYYADGYPVAEIAETWARSDNSVTRHIFGRCSHSDRPRDLSPSEVEAWECERLRATYNRNEKVDLPAVASAMRLRREVAAYHLFGLCECDHEEPPAEEDRPLDDRRGTPVEPRPVDNH